MRNPKAATSGSANANTAAPAIARRGVERVVPLDVTEAARRSAALSGRIVCIAPTRHNNDFHRDARTITGG
jgi:hypothetical protein